MAGGRALEQNVATHGCIVLLYIECSCFALGASLVGCVYCAGACVGALGRVVLQVAVALDLVLSLDGRYGFLYSTGGFGRAADIVFKCY